MILIDPQKHLSYSLLNLNHLLYLLNEEAAGLLWHFSWSCASLDLGQLFLLFAKLLETRNLHAVRGGCSLGKPRVFNLFNK